MKDYGSQSGLVMASFLLMGVAFERFPFLVEEGSPHNKSQTHYNQVPPLSQRRLDETKTEK